MFKKLNNLFYILCYGAVFSAAVAAGINYVIIKNAQTVMQRKIDKVEKQISNNQTLFTQYQAEAQNTNNRFLLKERVKALDTDLRPINPRKVITISAYQSPELASR